MNNHYAIKAGLTTCPSTEQDLKDFLRLDEADCENLQIYLDTANNAVISYLSLALITQQFTLVIDGYPFVGTLTKGIAPINIEFQKWIELPYSTITTINTVYTIDEYGVETLVPNTDYIVDQYSTPARLKFTDGVCVSTNNRLKIVYTTGFGTDTEDVPNGIRLGILQVAGYLYEHRGECTPAQAISESGAGMALQPYRVMNKL